MTVAGWRRGAGELPATSSLRLLQGTPGDGNSLVWGTLESLCQAPGASQGPSFDPKWMTSHPLTHGSQTSETKGQRNKELRFRAPGKVHLRAQDLPAPPVRDPQQCPDAPAWTCVPLQPPRWDTERGQDPWWPVQSVLGVQPG